MVSRPRTPIPSLSTLIAFETVARLDSFTRAAEELHTSQSAVSRHIARLEKQISVRVFRRSRAGVRLTEAGSRLYEAVAGRLGEIERAIAEIGEMPDDQQVAIVCSHDAWELLFMPELDALREALGENALFRFSLGSGDPRDAAPDPDADILFTWDGRGAGPESLTIREAVGPVCSPEYADRNAAILDGPVGGWGGLTLLEFPAPDRRWASWEDWFAVAGRPDALPRAVELDSYGDVLKAAAAGQGVALGRRCWAERHVAAGVLVPLAADPVETDNAYHGLLTEKGQGKPLARDCLASLARSFQD